MMEIDYARTIMSLVLIIILLMIFIVAMKKIRLIRLAKNKQITIINTVPIGAKERIILLNVNNTNLLIGATPTHIETLHVFDQIEDAQKAEDDYVSEVKSFSEVLATQKNEEH